MDGKNISRLLLHNLSRLSHLPGRIKPCAPAKDLNDPSVLYSLWLEGPLTLLLSCIGILLHIHTYCAKIRGVQMNSRFHAVLLCTFFCNTSMLLAVIAYYALTSSLTLFAQDQLSTGVANAFTRLTILVHPIANVCFVTTGWLPIVISWLRYRALSNPFGSIVESGGINSLLQATAARRAAALQHSHNKATGSRQKGSKDDVSQTHSRTRLPTISSGRSAKRKISVLREVRAKYALPLTVCAAAFMSTVASFFELSVKPCQARTGGKIGTYIDATALRRNLWYKFIYRTMFRSVTDNFLPFISVLVLGFLTEHLMVKSRIEHRQLAKSQIRRRSTHGEMIEEASISAQRWLMRVFMLKFLLLRLLTVVLDSWELATYGNRHRSVGFFWLVAVSNYLVILNCVTDCPLLLLGKDAIRAIIYRVYRTRYNIALGNKSNTHFVEHSGAHRSNTFNGITRVASLGLSPISRQLALLDDQRIRVTSLGSVMAGGKAASHTNGVIDGMPHLRQSTAPGIGVASHRVNGVVTNGTFRHQKPSTNGVDPLIIIHAGASSPSTPPVVHIAASEPKKHVQYLAETEPISLSSTCDV